MGGDGVFILVLNDILSLATAVNLINNSLAPTPFHRPKLTTRFETHRILTALSGRLCDKDGAERCVARS